MRYIIMANGRARRWNDYLGIPKHLAPTPDGETLLQRTVRQLLEVEPGAEVIISAHEERYAVAGARLYTPRHADLEIDRFVPELMDRPCCYLYGDAYYTDDAMRFICGTGSPREILFFGNDERIFAVKVLVPARGAALVEGLRARIGRGEIPDCKGWQLYHAYQGMDLPGKAIGAGFVRLADATTDFNTPEEYRAFMEREEVPRA